MSKEPKRAEALEKIKKYLIEERDFDTSEEDVGILSKGAMGKFYFYNNYTWSFYWYWEDNPMKLSKLTLYSSGIGSNYDFKRYLKNRNITTAEYLRIIKFKKIRKELCKLGKTK